MNDNSSQGKIYFIHFHSVNVKENWMHLALKNSWPGARINVVFRLSWKYFNRISITIKIFPKHLVCFEHQNHVMLFQSFILSNNSVEKNINIQQTLFFSFSKNAKPIKQKKSLTLVIQQLC